MITTERLSTKYRTPDECSLIGLAKSAVMRQLGWTEDTAYVALRRAAQNRRKTLVVVAAMILDAGAAAVVSN